MPRANKGPRIELYGPDDRYGARPRPGFKKYLYYFVWSEGGRRREKSSGVEHGGDPKTSFAAFLTELAAARPLDGPRRPGEMTVAEVLDAYGRQVAPRLRSARRIGYSIEALVEAFGDRTIDRINTAERKRFVQRRVTPAERVMVVHGKEIRRTYAVSQSTARRDLGVLDAAARFCVSEGLLASYSEKQWLPDAPPPRERYLQRSEVAAILWKARKDKRIRGYLPLFILIAIYTGRRSEAIRTLQWSPNDTGGWVDLQNGRIDFRRQGAEGSKKRRGVIPIPAPLRFFLDKARQRTERYVLEYEGRPIGNLSGSLKTAGKRAGIENVHAHLLKHTTVTWFARRGVPIDDVAAYTETSVDTLLKVYEHNDPARHERVLKSFRRR